ncbi:DNA primase [Nitrosophilus labii]|uniref:DNA primase n=1 Tax=Nitrosophilus labii TaxID=2706014 RepID=UPI001656CF73|nr:DNA primase [Nitrosophilus labii]
MIDKTSIEQLKSRIDIVDVVGNYLELKKSGANFKALCPFHNEDTPSFVVSPAKQIFHCFGCGVGGDAIKFVMEYEKLSYPEAVEKLASMFNIDLKYSGDKDKGQDLFKVLNEINRFYKKTIDQNEKAKQYLKKRGVFESSIEKFEIGFAPSSNETLQYLKSKFIPFQEAVEAGILAVENSKVYARLIERITFPIYSPNGRLVGFGGRTITNHPAKYINSPQTKLFNKSKLLYGYHLAKNKIFKTKKMIVTEGYLDVVMLHQAGFTNAVATLGTALTKDHLPLLRRGEPKVVLAYDGDQAGVAAALKAAKMLSASDMEGGVVLFEGDKDPADMVKEGKVEELENIFRHPKPFIEFVLEKTVQKYDINSPIEKEKALNESIEFLKTLSSLLQEEYKHFVAALLNITPGKIKLSKSFKNYENKLSQNKDTKELTIIKTLLAEPNLINTVLDYIDERHFNYHKEEFKLLLEQKSDHPKLISILLDDDIKTYKEDELKKELLIFLIKYYEQKLKTLVKAKDISFEEKSFKIRKYKDLITKLKRGELAIYD